MVNTAVLNWNTINDKPVETPGGKKNRQIREAEANQLTLFDYDNI